METQSEQLEREANHIRAQLSETLAELRARITPGYVIDQLMDYARDGAAAESLRNLAREIRENPLPLVLIGIGIAWLMVASSRSSRAVIASAVDLATRKDEWPLSDASDGAAAASSQPDTPSISHQRTPQTEYACEGAQDEANRQILAPESRGPESHANQ